MSVFKGNFYIKMSVNNNKKKTYGLKLAFAFIFNLFEVN